MAFSLIRINAMADVTISSIKLVTGQISSVSTLAATAALGDAGYYNGDKKFAKCDANAQATAAFKGLLLTPGNEGDIALFAKPGAIVDVGTVLTKAKVYILSENAGKIKPIEDLNTGEFLTIVGFALSTSQLELIGAESGIDAP
jgi:hypothetical protein